MTNYGYPARVWEMGGVDKDGKQLWYSREPTAEDHKRRREFEAARQKRMEQ